jgi:hypothetical protein
MSEFKRKCLPEANRRLGRIDEAARVEDVISGVLKRIGAKPVGPLDLDAPWVHSLPSSMQVPQDAELCPHPAGRQSLIPRGGSWCAPRQQLRGAKVTNGGAARRRGNSSTHPPQKFSRRHLPRWRPTGCRAEYGLSGAGHNAASRATLRKWAAWIVSLSDRLDTTCAPLRARYMKMKFGLSES